MKSQPMVVTVALAATKSSRRHHTNIANFPTVAAQLSPADSSLSAVAAKGGTLAQLPHSVRQMELKDLAPCFNLGSALFTSQVAATLYRTWDEFEISESFYSMPELCFVAVSKVLYFFHPLLPPKIYSPLPPSPPLPPTLYLYPPLTVPSP